MNLISGEELRAKLDRGDTFKLVLTLSEWAFRAKHIPGSLNINSRNKALATLDPDDENVLYCASEFCPARITAYQVL